MTVTAPPNARVVYDLDDPAFPHGTTTGYSRRCRRECCMAAERRRDKTRELERLRGIQAPPRAVPEDMARAAQRHLNDLIENHNASACAIGRHLNLGIATILKAQRGKPMIRSTYDAIMSVKPYDVDRTDHVDAAPFLLLSGQMQALGYPMMWQAEQAGLAGKSLIAILGKVRRGQQKWLEPATARAITAVSERVAGKVANARRDGIEPRDIARAKSVAKRNGFYPPAAYNEDGTLDWRAIPDHPWTIINESCHEHIERLEVALREHELGAKALAALTLDYSLESTEPGSPEHTEFVRVEMAYRRMLEGLGIRAIDGGREKRAELREALWQFMRRGVGDPVSFCIDNGIISARSTKIPSDHPAVAEQRAKETAEREEARKEAKKRARQDEAAKAARNRQQQAWRDRMTPEERKSYNERKRIASQKRRAARTERVAA